MSSFAFRSPSSIELHADQSGDAEDGVSNQDSNNYTQRDWSLLRLKQIGKNSRDEYVREWQCKNVKSESSLVRHGDPQQQHQREHDQWRSSPEKSRAFP